MVRRYTGVVSEQNFRLISYIGDKQRAIPMTGWSGFNKWVGYGFGRQESRDTGRADIRRPLAKELCGNRCCKVVHHVLLYLITIVGEEEPKLMTLPLMFAHGISPYITHIITVAKEDINIPVQPGEHAEVKLQWYLLSKITRHLVSSP